MKSKIFLLISFVSTLSFANSDLNLGGTERWEARHTGYICDAFKAETYQPESHIDLEVSFKYLRTDRSLDNGLIKASFIEGEGLCSYSAILFADNAASTIKLVESKAYAFRGISDCKEGKALLDKHLTDNDYLYWGHPHHVTIMVPVKSAESICGEGATHVGIDFTVSGRLDK